MLSLLQIELFKIFKRPRTYIAFAVITAIILLVQVALKFGGDEYIGLMMSGLNETFEVPAEEILNGYLVCFIILNLLLIHVQQVSAHGSIKDSGLQNIQDTRSGFPLPVLQMFH